MAATSSRSAPPALTALNHCVGLRSMAPRKLSTTVAQGSAVPRASGGSEASGARAWGEEASRDPQDLVASRVGVHADPAGGVVDRAHHVILAARQGDGVV